MLDLKQRFHELALSYTGNADLVAKLWLDIEKAHQEKGRHYHNFSHLENLFIELDAAHDQINDWGTVSFSVFYHDAVYNVSKKDNEERSADMAVKALVEIGYPVGKTERCKAQIIATKTHYIMEDHDANLFTDADLSILGKDWETYEAYVKNTRKEYKVYPNLIYKPGRKKILKHFLEMPQIFKTTYFREKYEVKARENIERELG